MYGVPHGRGANLLMYEHRTRSSPAPTSWDVVFDRTPDQYSGKVTAYDNPIYIADAALYLREHNPELGITDPYELDQEQFDAAIDLLKQQKRARRRVLVRLHEGDPGVRERRHLVGTTWQVTRRTCSTPTAPSEEVVLPEEGATGWSDTWMISSEAEHPNCTYMWMDHIISPEANAAVAEWFGEAPANEKACEVKNLDRPIPGRPLRDLPRGRRGVLRPDRVLEDARLRLRRRPR